MLSTIKKEEFRDKGFLVIPQVVPGILVKEALKAVNTSLGREGIDKANMELFQNRSFCPELMQDERLFNLFLKTPALEIAELLIGKGKVKPPHEAQIALRFPLNFDRPEAPCPHIDGFYAPKNDVEKGKIFSFTALAGFYLNDVDEDWCGNFTTWPGSHRMIRDYFQNNEPDPYLTNGIPPIALGAPLQIKAKAGDLIFCHYQLAHAAAWNLSPNIRYCIFFRIEHVEHHLQRIETMKNIYLEWEGLKLLC